MAESNLKKNKSGYGYKYTDLASIHEYLEANGYRYKQTVETAANGFDYIITIPIKDGKEEGPVRGCRIPEANLSGKSNPAQELGAALTYARRYSLLMAFGLATTDDDAACMTTYTDPTQEAKDRAKAIKQLNDKCNADNIDIKKLCSMMKVESLSQLDSKKYSNIMDNWDQVKEKCSGTEG